MLVQMNLKFFQSSS